MESSDTMKPLFIYLRSVLESSMRDARMAMNSAGFGFSVSAYLAQFESTSGLLAHTSVMTLLIPFPTASVLEP